jgi:hypothetical protein
MITCCINYLTFRQVLTLLLPYTLNTVVNDLFPLQVEHDQVLEKVDRMSARGRYTMTYLQYVLYVFQTLLKPFGGYQRGNLGGPCRTL